MNSRNRIAGQKYMNLQFEIIAKLFSKLYSH